MKELPKTTGRGGGEKIKHRLLFPLLSSLFLDFTESISLSLSQLHTKMTKEVVLGLEKRISRQILHTAHPNQRTHPFLQYMEGTTAAS